MDIDEAVGKSSLWTEIRCGLRRKKQSVASAELNNTDIFDSKKT